MSHFAVLVVLTEKPTMDALESALAPWHQFGSTARNDGHVIDVDITEKARGRYGFDTTCRLRDEGGNLHEMYDVQGELKPEFSKLAEDGYSTAFVPDGYEEVQIPVRDIEDEAAWISAYYGIAVAADTSDIDLDGRHKFGHVLIGEAGAVVRVVQRTNPNGKWDSWTLGGRYSGRLKPGYNPEKDPANQEACFICGGTGLRDDSIGLEQRRVNPEYTCNGCKGLGRRPKWPSHWTNIGNTSRLGDLDLAALKDYRVAERRAFVEEIREKSGLSSSDFEIGYRSAKAAHSVWQELPDPRPQGSEYSEWLETQPEGNLAAIFRRADTWQDIEPSEGQSIEAWIGGTPALSAYAVIIDGRWHSKGEMGWFGVSHGETGEWPVELQNMLSTIPDDRYIAFVDCHT